MHTDPALKMYEAMAIAEEKDAEIDILKKERAELLELMKRIGNGRRSTGGRHKPKVGSLFFSIA